MATSGNRSPSPISARPNPNSRTPETNSTMRRSFSGNPFPRPSIHPNPRNFTPTAPADSPASDFGRRHSIGKEEKENEKPVKIRSPAIAKGTKNFMTPTISAASKINASPKKKVLVERNEPVRISLSFSDGKSPFGSMNFSDFAEDLDSKSDMGLDQNKAEDPNNSAVADSKKDASSLNSKVPLNSHNFSDVKRVKFNSSSADSKSDMGLAEDSNNSTITDSKQDVPLNSEVQLNTQDFVESNSTGVEIGCKIKPLVSSISPIIAPLDADPSLPPYDPKTNFLSPRPQFLHYKPNPRIGRRLDESFLSESFSDTEFAEETESDDSHKESEDDSCAEVVNEVVEAHVSEPKQETFEEKRVLKVKPQFFTRPKSVALVLVLLIACVSVTVTDSPVFDLSEYKDLSTSKLYDPSEIAEFVKTSVDGFTRNLQQWSANSVVYLSKLIGSLGEVDKLGPMQFSNLTSLLEDPFIDGYLKVDHTVERYEEIHEQEDLEPEAVGEVEEEVLYPNVEADDYSEEGLERQGIEVEVEAIEPHGSEVAQNQEQSDVSSLSIIANQVSDTGFEDQSALNSDAPGFRPEVEVLELVGNGEIQGDKIESTIAEVNSESKLEMDASVGDVGSFKSVEDNSSMPYVQKIPLLSLALALVAATTFFAHLKHRRITTTQSDAVVVPLLSKKLMVSNPSAQIWPADVDAVGESCRSEMSSFSYSKKGFSGPNETAQSQERKYNKVPKRESLASSSEYSMGSPSYGSFTTYEKIPSKHGCGDEEIVTPVRRSSRIKSQVTSPL